MPKSLNRCENQVLLELFRAKRLKAGLTQAELSQRLQRVQSFIRDVERGECRLDLVQQRDLAHAVGTDLVRLVKDFEIAVVAVSPHRSGTRR